jgi:hypothetical protein
MHATDVKMSSLVSAAAFLLQCKLPSLPVEATLANAVNLSVDGVRFMLAFFAACICGIVLRRIPGITSAVLTRQSDYRPPLLTWNFVNDRYTCTL